ncbi:MAG TPA: class I poly(R)-hydroxyalkanoic acid synthase [Burkholderiales bacterium]|nr:class I poly(R)-hydroxyalkanoic acid synthase [Burkholderiales bacterium]
MSTTESQRKPFDPAEMMQLYADIARKSSELLTRVMQKAGSDPKKMFDDELGIAHAFFDAWVKMASDPVQLVQSQMKAWQDYSALWQNALLSMAGQKPVPVAEANKGDRRFRHEDWHNKFLFDYLKQSYLIASRHLHKAMCSVHGLDENEAKKVDFYTRQYIDALSPSNFALTNPEVLQETVRSGGKNLLKGFNNLLDDLTQGDGAQLRVKMVDGRAFKLGENIAATPGKVIFQNDLLQLIQYTPTTKEVYRRPLLIVPPWINKFYVLDMRADNSFVRWAVAQGHTVFIVSWINPDAKYARKTFEDYLSEGTLAAIDAALKASGTEDLNLIGFCLGGTLAAAALGYLTAHNDKRVASTTFFATLVDFKQAGELEVFIDEQQIAALEKRMNKRGYLEGSEMATTFNMLRANDLIWSFVVNNYLMGRDPMPFDLLYWNADSTRMPAAMHSFYLRNMYMKNLLREPGGITLSGTPIDLSIVKTPLYFVSTVEDHIAPWKTVYAGARVFNSPIRFVLGGSGHIAGIVNPPSANKYGYWTNEKLADDPDAWLGGAKQHAGSWWTDWQQWVDKHGGGKVAARVPGKGKLKVLEDAPGSYVSVRLDSAAPNANLRSG